MTPAKIFSENDELGKTVELLWKDATGPVLIKVEGKWQLAGLASWKKHVQDNDLILHAGFYGQKNYNVRVSHYAGWIEDKIRAN